MVASRRLIATVRVGMIGAAIARAPAAFALDPSCPAPFTHGAWVVAMNQIDAALTDSRVEAARSGLDQTKAALICLDGIAKPGHVARFARQEALAYFFDQDEEAAVKWGNAARYAAPDYPWSLPEDHPFRILLTSADEPPLGGPAGGLRVDKGDFVFLDGVPIVTPRARSEVPSLIQVTDKKGAIVRAFWQDGAAFPADIIDPAGPALPPATWFVADRDYASSGGPETRGTTPDVAIASPVVPDPVKHEPIAPPPPDKPPHDKQAGSGGIGIAQAAAGGGLGALAGVLYVGAAITAGHMDSAGSVAQLVRTRAVANDLVVGAAIAGVAAVGVGATAFLTDGGVGLGIHGRF